MKYCHNRYDDGVYLQTCVTGAGHGGAHRSEDGVVWAEDKGWWDVYGDQPEKARRCACERPLVANQTMCMYCEYEQEKQQQSTTQETEMTPSMD